MYRMGSQPEELLGSGGRSEESWGETSLGPTPLGCQMGSSLILLYHPMKLFLTRFWMTSEALPNGGSKTQPKIQFKENVLVIILYQVLKRQT